MNVSCESSMAGQPSPAPGKNHGSAWQPKMSTLSVLPGEPSVTREIAQEEDAALFEAVLNPKPHKDSLQECLQGKTEDASPGLAWR